MAITTPTRLDVILGRGRLLIDHFGNKRLRRITKARQAMYFSARKSDKTLIIKQTLEEILHCDEGEVRFIEKDKSNPGTYRLLEYQEMHSKVSHNLREGKPKSAKAGKKAVKKSQSSRKTKTRQNPPSGATASEVTALTTTVAPDSPIPSKGRLSRDCAPNTPSTVVAPDIFKLGAPTHPNFPTFATMKPASDLATDNPSLFELVVEDGDFALIDMGMGDEPSPNNGDQTTVSKIESKALPTPHADPCDDSNDAKSFVSVDNFEYDFEPLSIENEFNNNEKIYQALAEQTWLLEI